MIGLSQNILWFYEAITLAIKRDDFQGISKIYRAWSEHPFGYWNFYDWLDAHSYDK